MGIKKSMITFGAVKQLRITERGIVDDKTTIRYYENTGPWSLGNSIYPFYVEVLKPFELRINCAKLPAQLARSVGLRLTYEEKKCIRSLGKSGKNIIKLQRIVTSTIRDIK